MSEDILRKVRKLLALANDTPSDEESQTALLKAQELMAQHSIEMSEIEYNDNSREVIHESITERGRTPHWKLSIARVISENFRCQYYRSSWGGKSQIRFLGLKEDVLIAKELFTFACDSLTYHASRYVRKRKKELEGSGAYSVDTTGLRNDYIVGFIKGLEDKFAKQVEEKGWGLVLVKHELVEQEITRMNFTTTTRRSNIRRQYDGEARREGYKTGNKLELRKQLKQ